MEDMRALAVVCFLAGLAPPARAQAGAPVVNDIAATVSSAAAVISWTTDRPSDTQVEYGPTPAYGNATPLDAAPVLAHSASLPGLAPGAIYHYRVKSRNAAGAAGVSGDYSFLSPGTVSDGAAAVPSPAASPPPPQAAPPAAAAPASSDKTPPTIVVMTPAAGAFVSKTVAVSANATDNIGVATVTFQLDGAALGTALTSAPWTFRWDTLTAPDGEHKLSAVASDAAGNTAASLVVPLTVDNVPPVLTGVSAASYNPGTAVVHWTTNKRADSRVEYGTTTAYGLASAFSASPVVEHDAALPGLAPETAYHFRVISRDQAGNLSATEDAVFTSGAGTAAAAGAAAASSDASARAPQKMLSPARPDGINDKATFGPEAREVSVFDIRGHRVFHAVSPGPSAPVIWDCKDGSGRVLESGVYLATIVKRDGGSLSQSFSIAK
jgi:hypothetical protein